VIGSSGRDRKVGKLLFKTVGKFLSRDKTCCYLIVAKLNVSGFHLLDGVDKLIFVEINDLFALTQRRTHAQEFGERENGRREQVGKIALVWHLIEQLDGRNARSQRWTF